MRDADIARVDWDDLSLEPLAEAIRRTRNGADAEKTIWAFERAVLVARIDPELLEYLLVATTCLIAGAEAKTPREVLGRFSRRAVDDETWRRDYERLLR